MGLGSDDTRAIKPGTAWQSCSVRVIDATQTVGTMLSRDAAGHVLVLADRNDGLDSATSGATGGMP